MRVRRRQNLLVFEPTAHLRVESGLSRGQDRARRRQSCLGIPLCFRRQDRQEQDLPCLIQWQPRQQPGSRQGGFRSISRV